MTEQEKQKLIKWLEEGIACSEEYGFRGNILKSMQIALTSLTEPPVKLPAPIGVFMFTSYVKKALDEAEIKYEVEG